jgi:hypothetical protein
MSITITGDTFIQDANGKITVTGTCDAGAALKVLIDDSSVTASITVSSQAFTVVFAVATGSHKLEIQDTRRSSESATKNITVKAFGSGQQPGSAESQ